MDFFSYIASLVTPHIMCVFAGIY